MLVALLRESLAQVPEGEVSPAVDAEVCELAANLTEAIRERDDSDRGYYAALGVELGLRLMAMPAYAKVGALVGGYCLGVGGVKLEGDPDA